MEPKTCCFPLSVPSPICKKAFSIRVCPDQNECVQCETPCLLFTQVAKGIQIRHTSHHTPAQSMCPECCGAFPFSFFDPALRQEIFHTTGLVNKGRASGRGKFREPLEKGSRINLDTIQTFMTTNQGQGTRGLSHSPHLCHSLGSFWWVPRLFPSYWWGSLSGNPFG